MEDRHEVLLILSSTASIQRLLSCVWKGLYCIMFAEQNP